MVILPEAKAKAKAKASFDKSLDWSSPMESSPQELSEERGPDAEYSFNNLGLPSLAPDDSPTDQADAASPNSCEAEPMSRQVSDQSAPTEFGSRRPSVAMAEDGFPMLGRRGSHCSSLGSHGMSRRGSCCSAVSGADWADAEAAQKLRHHLRKRFGNLRRAFKSFDTNGLGVLTFADFKQGLERECDAVRWCDICGCRDLEKLFKAFDVKNAGEITLTQMVGVSNETLDHEDQWQYLNTMEQWTRYCHNTDHATSKNKHERPLQQATEDINTIRCEHEKKRDRDRARMRRMIAQGMHRTKAGLHLAATHLPQDITSDHYNVKKYRREELENVNKKTKRIQQAINQSTSSRQELKHIHEELQAVQKHAKKLELTEFLAFHRTNGAESLFGKSTFTSDMCNTFNEEQLSLQEQHTRNLARSLGMPIPDAEAVYAQFAVFNKHHAGIRWKDFPKIMHALVGDVYSEAQVHDLWRTIEKDSNGHVSFDEYLAWYHHNHIAAPRLGLHGPVADTSTPECVAQTVL